MNWKIKIALSTSVLILGCASYPSTLEEQASYYVQEAVKGVNRDMPSYTASKIDEALSKPTGDLKVKNLFMNMPKSKEIYLSTLEKSIDKLSSPKEAERMLYKLSVAKSANVLKEDEIQNLFSKFNSTVTEGNISGKLSFTLGDDISNFESLKTAQHLNIIVNRTLVGLQGDTHATRLVRGLVDYVKSIGINSAQAKKIESLLPRMNIRLSELNVVSEVFPKFARERRESLTLHIYLDVKGADRLFKDDLLQTLQSSVEGVDWVTYPNNKAIKLTVERIRYDEKTLAERTQTIAYAQHQVNILSAALLMPNNASYLYEMVSGGSEIEYGYAVTAAINGKIIHDTAVRGKADGKYIRCQNARIQNVFGGVSPAGFIANDDMQSRCSGPTSASIEALRSEVLAKLANEVLRIKPIQDVYGLK